MTTDRRDRVLNWEDELTRIAPRLFDLPLAARLAIYEVVEQFLVEDTGRDDAPRLDQVA